TTDEGWPGSRIPPLSRKSRMGVYDLRCGPLLYFPVEELQDRCAGRVGGGRKDRPQRPLNANSPESCYYQGLVNTVSPALFRPSPAGRLPAGTPVEFSRVRFRFQAVQRIAESPSRRVAVPVSKYQSARPRSRFAEIIALPDESIDLAEAALLIAGEEFVR